MDFISLDRMLGLNYSGRKGFWENFTIGSMVKFLKGSKPNKIPKLEGFFILNETKSKKRIFERANLEDGF